MTRVLPRFTDAIETTEAAGLGALQCDHGNLPLEQIRVQAQVDGLACRTSIVQVFHNPHDEFVEASYIFPLPGRYAVTACTMRVADRVIEADLQERSQARAAYEQAIQSGHRAAIAEEDRSETFNLRVGNIPPQERVSVELTLVGNLSVAAGEATLRIPLVVAPRYVPGQPLAGPSVGQGTAVDTDQAPDASRVTPPTLLPGFPNPVELSIEVQLNLAGFAPADWMQRLQSSLHNVLVSDGEPCCVRLSPGERVNRDFILRFPLLPQAVQSALEYSHPTGSAAGVFALTVLPPASPPQEALPRDVAFVLDRSGSMGGWKMTAASRAVGRMIDSLGENDRFRVLAFDHEMESPPGNADWQAATDRNRWRATQWIAKIDARGGTELGGALRAALGGFARGMPESRQAVVVLATDGQVADEDSILRTIHSLGLPRMPQMMTLGIDSAVNASMLTRLAEQGGGAFELVESEERLDQVMARFQREIGSPVLTQLRIEPLEGDLIARSVAPSRLPDLFADRPLTIYGRIAGEGKAVRMRLVGVDAHGNPWSQELTAPRTERPSLLPLWGRSHVRELEDRYACGGGEASKLQSQIVAVSLESRVLSRFTAYVAIDRAEIVNQGGVQHQVVQPVERPEGWRFYDPAGRVEKFQKAFPKYRRLQRRSRPESPSAPSQPAPADLIPESLARENRVMPVEEKDGKLVVRMSDPNDSQTIDTAIDFTETRPEEPVSPTTPDDPQIVRLVHLLVAEGIQLGASHLYLRPETEGADVHYLIEGASRLRDRLPLAIHELVAQRVGQLAKLSPPFAQLQTGEFQVTVGDGSISVRVFLIPTDSGTAILLRISNKPLPANFAQPEVVQRWLRDAGAADAADPLSVAIHAQLAAESGQ